MTDRYDVSLDGDQLAKMLGPRCPMCLQPAGTMGGEERYFTCRCGAFYGNGDPWVVFQQERSRRSPRTREAGPVTDSGRGQGGK